MKTVAIIQARVGSSRLPGKVLKDIAGMTMLERVVRRVQKFRGVNEVIIATSDAQQDEQVAEIAASLAVPCFRGNESDVLDRYLRAAEQYGAEVCVRVTSDCPLIDPEVSSEILRRFLKARPAVDYASNKIPQSFPRGLDTEVFTRDALAHAWRLAKQPYQRSHVTSYLYEHPEQFKLLSVTSDTDRADWRWTVDTTEDLQFVREIYRRLDISGDFSWSDVVALLEREPELREINRHIVQKPARAG